MSEMGRRIRDLRLDAGLTQEQLGDMVGLQKSAIAKYENGKTENMKRSVIQKMAEVLGVSPSYLMGFEDDAPYYIDPAAAEFAKEIANRDDLRIMLLFPLIVSYHQTIGIPRRFGCTPCNARNTANVKIMQKGFLWVSHWRLYTSGII